MTILEPPSETRWLVTVSGSDEPDSVTPVREPSELARVVAVAAMLGKAKRVTVTTPGTSADPGAERWAALRAALEQLREDGGYYDRNETVSTVSRLMSQIEAEIPT